MTPYGKGQGGSSSPGSASSPSGGGSATGGADNYLAQRGYIEVVEDVRGTGNSGGSWGLFDPIQQQDAIQVLNWAAQLPHSDGKVGTYGPSYLGIDQLLLAGAVGKHSPLKAIFPMVTANDIYRDTSFMGGLLDSEFDEAYLGLTGGLNTANPVGDTLSDPTLLSELAAIEADHANGLASYHAGDDREHPQRRRRGLRRVLLAGPQPAEHPRARRRQPDPGLPDRWRVRHLPARRADQLRRAAERLGRPQRDRADEARASGHRPLPADRRAVGAHQRLERRRRPARARVVRHLAQGRAHRHGEDHDAAALLRPRHGPVRRDHDLPVHRATPTRLYFGPAHAHVRRRRRAARRATRSPGARRQPVRARRRPVVDGRHLDPGQHRRDCSRRAPTTTSLAGRPVDDELHDRAVRAAEAVAGPITATVYASATTPETELVAELEDVTPSGTSYPLTEGALLGSLRAVDRQPLWTAGGVTLLPYHPYTKASAAARHPREP